MEKVIESANNFTKLKTAQGVPLYVMPLPHHETVAVGVLVHAGCRDEVWPSQAGLAHALEHMFFQGTERFAGSKELSAYLERVGGVINAWTWTEMTFYWRSAPAAFAERAWETLAEQLRFPTFPEAKIPVEMKNVVQEIRRAHDDPKSFVARQANSLFYGSHPLGRDTLGTEAAVSSFTQKDFKGFWQKYYRPENFVFIVAGKITPEAAQKLFETHFPEPATGTTRTLAPEAFVPPAPATHKLGREIQQVHLNLTWPAPAASHADYPALRLFQTMVSGGMSFPLFQEVRDRLGLCYEVRASLTPWSDAGAFVVYVGTDPERYEQAVRAVKEVMAKTATDEELFKAAQTTMIGRLALTYESPADIISLAAQDVTRFGEARGYKEAIAQIESVSFADIARVVAKYLDPAQAQLTLLAPHR